MLLFHKSVLWLIESRLLTDLTMLWDNLIKNNTQTVVRNMLNLYILIMTWLFVCTLHTFSKVIVSITKFSIVIGSPRAYLSRNRRAITWVSNYRCPIWTFSNETAVIGYPRDFHVNYARFNGFLGNVFYSFQNLGKRYRRFHSKEVLRKHF